ncbi:MAG: alpha/beta fold hydrolase [Desulfosarcinaceae bacterium]|nr:alpha/beta fold hydrolase [Desulfosarcinaceae bacterium]
MDGFRPPVYLRNGGVQTLLASRRPHHRRRNPVVRIARHVRIATASGATLGGAYAPQLKRPSKGTVILIHGWEGSIDSTYVLTTSAYLYRRGYAVFRLNLRDHGDTHALNEGLFFATLLDEVHQAVNQIARLASDHPVFLVGFSLGGNFALRIAKRCRQHPITGLRYVFSISPVLHPDKATDCIDANPFILAYFLRKWRRSLRRKETLFPNRYRFDGLLGIDSLREMTAALLPRYSPYQNVSTYFNAYALTHDALADLAIPTSIVTAADDPIIPVEDFYRLKLNPQTECIVLKYGGHNGFLKGVFQGCWYEATMVERFEACFASSR